MDFALLQQRLVAHIRERVRGGEVTERRLARLTGISQPHVHNVLKGARALSPELADHFLRELRISVLDLLEPQEIERRMAQRGLGNRRAHEVPFLAGRLGPGFPYPHEESDYESYPFPRPYIELLQQPAAARLAPDPDLPHPLEADDVVLLARDESSRLPDGSSGLYAIALHGESFIRRVLFQSQRLCLIGRHSRQCIVLPDTGTLDLIKGKVLWFGRRLEPVIFGSTAVRGKG